MKAYDIHLTKAPADRSAKDHAGWCFGYPPGISPLDPNSGYPLMHGFTLLLPEDYRCHGPEIVALSFFAIAPDHNDGMPLGTEEIKTLLKPATERPANRDLAALWDHAQSPHPCMTYMKDILGCAYAVILLTKDEFEGPLCPVPSIAENSKLSGTRKPQWLLRKKKKNFLGSKLLGNLFVRDQGGTQIDSLSHDPFFAKLIGGNPNEDAGFNCGIRLIPRAVDPNAGVTPEDSPDENSVYKAHYDLETFEPLEWGEDHAPDHIGGTMRPVQAVPEGFSAYYVEFEEYFGDYNFGGGNGQFDFKTLKFDWACG